MKQISLKQEVCVGGYLMGVSPLGNWLAESNQICQSCRILKDAYKMLKIPINLEINKYLEIKML